MVFNFNQMNEIIKSGLINGNDVVNIYDYMQLRVGKCDYAQSYSTIKLSESLNEIGLLFELSDVEFDTTYDNFIEILNIYTFFENIQKFSKRPLIYKEIFSFMLPYKFEGLYFIDTAIFNYKKNGFVKFDWVIALVDIYNDRARISLNIEDKSYHSEITVSLYDDIQSKLIDTKIVEESPDFKTYIIKDSSSKLFKIGRSINPRRRHRDIYTANPTTLLLMFCNKDIESDLHKKYKKKHVSGEWFRLSDVDLVEILNEFKEIGGEFFDVK